jgi:hypothetical protein
MRPDYFDDVLGAAAACDSDGTDDEDVPRPVVVTDPEVWADYHSEFLLTLWHSLSDQARAMGVPVLDRCQFSDFVGFAFDHSSGHVPPC